MEGLTFTENFILEEYKALWDYYKKTLDERKKLFDWFLLIITLPSSAIGYLIFNQDQNISIPNIVSALLLMLIYLIGLSLFITYTYESRNADNYLKAIRRIRNHFRKSDKKFRDLLIIDKSRQKNSHIFGKFDIIKLSRSFVFILINSATFSSSIILFANSRNLILLIVCFLFSFTIHLIIFSRVYKK